ncbi:hypothetical protein [Modestobacter sp. Leaf380]|uniref:hypothetical protein n=1 Tax=Modestobacter sp. Leaf380 TaxID=1736356 RepID=UPI0006F58495|nr:hypothetical protein [Modestobacter sp. Leaf380]KQS69821.1 hypothetical protein ASG41_21195 [Modestobacter sp. Leaf380]
MTDETTEDTTPDTTPGTDDDPGRDPAGLDPPRDLFSAAGTLPEHGSYDPGSSQRRPAQSPPPGDDADRAGDKPPADGADAV